MWPERWKAQRYVGFLDGVSIRFLQKAQGIMTTTVLSTTHAAGRAGLSWVSQRSRGGYFAGTQNRSHRQDCILQFSRDELSAGKQREGPFALGTGQRSQCHAMDELIIGSPLSGRAFPRIARPIHG
jgi:hypothetical protein